MIIGLGNDLCDGRRIARILERFGERFLQRIFTDIEQKRAKTISYEQRVAFFTRRFAAKEACAKALGTGFSQGVGHRDIGVVTDSIGRPSLNLTGGAARQLEKIMPVGTIARLHLSLTDEIPLAAAMVVIEALEKSR